MCLMFLTEYFWFSDFASLLKSLFYLQNIFLNDNRGNADLGVQRQNQCDEGSFIMICN